MLGARPRRLSASTLLVLTAAAAAAQEPPKPTTLVQLLDEPGTWRQILQTLLFKAVNYLPQVVAALVVLLAFVVVERLAAWGASCGARRQTRRCRASASGCCATSW